MPRATNNPASRKRRKRKLKEAKGFQGGRSKLIRTATESVKRSLAFAYRDRRQKKRNFRTLWNTRISAACKGLDFSYSEFIGGLKKANISLNRKMLAEIAAKDSQGFSKLVDLAKQK